MDHIATPLLSLALVVVAAQVGGHFASRIGQPAVVGELAAGIVLGNLTLVDFTRLDFLKTAGLIDFLSHLGVILLLFQVGVESTVGQMLKVGLSSFLVATVDVVGPLLLGWAVSLWLLPSASWYTHVFLGTTLIA